MVRTPFGRSRHQWKESVPFEIALGRWQHLIATWSAQEGVQIYVNGLLKDNIDHAVDSAAVQTDNKEFIIGDNGSGQFTLDDFLVYYRHVNEDEAKTLFLDRYFDDKQIFAEHWGPANFTLAKDVELPRTTIGLRGTKAISFNGVDDSVSLGNMRTSCFGNLDHCDDGITYSLWLKATNKQNKDPSQTVYYLSSGAQSRWSMGVALYSRRGMMSWSFKTSTKWWRKEGQFPVKYDEWQHVMATWSPARGVAVYVNGDLMETFNYTMDMDTSGRYNNFVLGRPNHSYRDGLWNGEFMLEDLKAYYFEIFSDACAKDIYTNAYPN